MMMTVIIFLVNLHIDLVNQYVYAYAKRDGGLGLTHFVNAHKHKCFSYH